MAVATGAITLPAEQPSAAASHPVPVADRTGRAGRLLIPAAAAALLVALSLGAARLSGAEWFVVTTPSMGTAIPVGALVVDAPVAAEALAVGDVITFTPPGPAQSVHTHRIVAITSEGVRTRGDANGAADPWVLAAHDVRGRVVAALPGVGLLMRVLPLLLVGGLLTWGATLVLRRRDHRAAAVLLGTSLSLSAATVLFRPLVDAVLVTATSGSRGAVATVVSTGLLPIRVSAGSGAHVDLVDGQVGVIRSTAASGPIDLTVAVHLPPLGWALLIAVLALPSAVPLLAALRTRSA